MILRDVPTSEKHYALFMSSLSAHSRELCLESMYFEEKDIIHRCLYTEISS